MTIYDHNSMQIAALILNIALLIGCGGSAAVAPVSGVVTLDGKPLANVNITTQPIGADSIAPGSGSFAKTDDKGRFELEMVTPAQPGAVVGEHRVMVSQPVAIEAGGANADIAARRATAERSRQWPTKFTDGSLRLVVPPEGDNNLRLDLAR